jgi:hypothetical protein
MFFWRAYNNILPTKENLLQRRVVSDNLYHICTFDVETTAHILWHCPSAQDVWCSGPLSFQKSTVVSLNFKCLFEEMIDKFECDDLAFWTIIARTIWFITNLVVQGGSFSPPEKVIRKVTISI